MLRHVRLTTLVALFVVVPAVAVAAAPFAYVTNSGSSNILVIDTASASTSMIAMPAAPPYRIPWGVALSPDGSRVYVTNFTTARGGASLLAFETGSGRLIREVPMGNFPFGVVAHPTNGKVYVSLSGNGKVMVVDPATFTNLDQPPVVEPIFVGSPRGIALDPSGTRLFVASNFDGMLYAFSAGSPYGPLGSVAVGVSPLGVAVSPDGSSVYVTNEGSNTVSVVNAANGTLTVAADVPVGTAPAGVSVTPDGALVYIANSGSGTVSILTATGRRAHDDVYVGSYPYGISTNGSSVYVALQAASKVVELSLSGALVREIAANVPVAFGQFLLPQVRIATAMALALSAEETILGSTTPMTATATLRRQDNNAPVAGMSIAFTLDGAAGGTAVTGSDGTAQWSFSTASLPAGPHGVQASFAETRAAGVVYLASSAALRFGVRYQFTWLSSGGTANAGSAIPVRWQATDANGNPIPTAQFSITSAVCVSGASIAAPGVKTQARFAGSSDLRYDASSGQYSFNWKTDKAWAGSCRQLFVDSNDGASHSLTFQFH